MRSAAAGMLFFDGQLRRDKFALATENHELRRLLGEVSGSLHSVVKSAASCR
jgi:hypothetical protein